MHPKKRTLTRRAQRSEHQKVKNAANSTQESPMKQKSKKASPDNYYTQVAHLLGNTEVSYGS